MRILLSTRNRYTWFAAAAVFSFLAIVAIVQTTGIRELIPPLPLMPSLFGGLAWTGYRKQKRVGE